jgi:homoserine kinase
VEPSLVAEPVLDGVRLGVSVTARAPASSANLGPGFDSLGLALGLYDEVTAEAFAAADGAPSALVEVTGEGAGAVPLGEDHLVVRSLRSGLAYAGAGRPDLRLTCRNAIPHGRGLGSSAAAIAVGLVLARGLLAERERLDDDAVFALASAAEGHPDNAAAALFGGFTVAWTDPPPHGPGGPGALPVPGVVRLEVDPRVQVVLCVPEFELPTSTARAMLPATVPHGDAAFNAGRAALLVEALTRRPEVLFAATEDRLHQGQRAPAMPLTASLLEAVRDRGGAAVVSGAGPSVLVLGIGDAPATAVGAALAAAPAHGAWGSWRVLTLPIDRSGTVVTSQA